jgi:hypothetical protein
MVAKGRRIQTMTKGQLSLLLYLETRAVDHSGRVNGAQMNKEDMDQARQWADEGFIGFGRIVMKDHTPEGTHWVELSDAAWTAAHQERRARANRMLDERRWTKTSEK